MRKRLGAFGLPGLWPPPPTLLLLLLLLQLRTAGACMEGAWRSGLLGDGDLVDSFSVDPAGGGSCVCCGLCHQHQYCASLSFSPATGECRLFGSVASFSSLTPDNGWQYFIMPGRSQHEQFCRQDSDCQVSADACRGRICTELRAVTCRTMFETFSTGQRYGDNIPGMYGWVSGQQLRLFCRMNSDKAGATRLFLNKADFKFDSQTVMNLDSQPYDGEAAHSLLHLAEDIRQLGTESTYRVWIYSNEPHMEMDFTVPRDAPVLGTGPRIDVGAPSHVGQAAGVFNPTLPYVPGSGPTLLTTNGDAVRYYNGGLAAPDGLLYWQGNVSWIVMYIRE